MKMVPKMTKETRTAVLDVLMATVGGVVLGICIAIIIETLAFGDVHVDTFISSRE